MKRILRWVAYRVLFLEYMNTLDEKIHVLGIDDHYVCHGSVRSLRIQEGISTECLFEELEKHG